MPAFNPTTVFVLLYPPPLPIVIPSTLNPIGLTPVKDKVLTVKVNPEPVPPMLAALALNTSPR